MVTVTLLHSLSMGWEMAETGATSWNAEMGRAGGRAVHKVYWGPAVLSPHPSPRFALSCILLVAWHLSIYTVEVGKCYKSGFLLFILRAGFKLLTTHKSATLRIAMLTSQPGSAGTKLPPHLDCVPLKSHAGERHHPPHFPRWLVES